MKNGVKSLICWVAVLVILHSNNVCFGMKPSSEPHSVVVTTNFPALPLTPDLIEHMQGMINDAVSAAQACSLSEIQELSGIVSKQFLQNKENKENINKELKERKEEIIELRKQYTQLLQSLVDMRTATHSTAPIVINNGGANATSTTTTGDQTQQAVNNKDEDVSFFFEYIFTRTTFNIALSIGTILALSFMAEKYGFMGAIFLIWLFYPRSA